MTSPDKTRLVAIMDSPVPYTTPVLNALAKRLDLHAVFLSGADNVYGFSDSWGVTPEFDYSVFWRRQLHVPSVDLQLEFTVGLARSLARMKPDAVLLLSWKPTGLEPLLWSRWSGCAAVMWAESTRFSGLFRNPLATRLRASLARVFDGYVSNGSQAAKYLEELGVPSARIVTSRLPAGIQAQTTRRTGRRFDEGVRFLFVGRLVARKRPLELIRTFAKVREELPDATLTVVGKGELSGEVCAAAASQPGVHFAGHCEGAGLASHYSESDVLVLPALREVWGIVVNEAVSHGLFVIATDQVGSAYDLLDEETGILLPAEDIDRLAPSLIEAARTVDLSDEARHRRASVMTMCTPDRFAADIRRATDVAMHVRARRQRGRPAVPTA